VKQQQPVVQVNIPPITVPPSQVIIERPGGQVDSQPLSFLQIGGFVATAEHNLLIPGRTVALNVAFQQKGPNVVTDAHDFVYLLPVNTTAKGEYEEARKKFRELREAAHRNEGASVGVGQYVYSTAISPVLSQQDVDGILKGDVKLVLQAWAIWKGAQGTTGKIDQCWWLEKPATIDLSAGITLANCP
jgi:hypothetical protein